MIPLNFAQAQSGEGPEAGEIPLSSEQMCRAGALLQKRVAQEQWQQRAAPARRQSAITEELSIERQARQLAERKIAELEAQMARMRPLAQELGQRHESRGQQVAPMIPRPLQVGASEQRHQVGNRQSGPPQMATRDAQPQMAPLTYAQVAQVPPRQALPCSVEETRHRQEITHGKRAAEAPQVAGAPRAAPRAQAPPSSVSDLQAGLDVPGTSHLSADLHWYVSRWVQQYMDKQTGTLVNAGPTTDSPVLDMEMVEEDRLAWQQLATRAHLRRSPDGDHPMLGDNDDVTGDDWESLDAEDFLMGESHLKQNLPTDR